MGRGRKEKRRLALRGSLQLLHVRPGLVKVGGKARTRGKKKWGKRGKKKTEE